MATKDFVTYTPSTGNGNATVDVTASANTGGLRSITLNIEGLGISKSITINQKQTIVHFQALATLLTPNSGEFEIAIGTSSAQSPKVEIPYPASLGVSYDTTTIDYEVTSSKKIRCQIAFLGMKFGDGLNYLDFQVYGLNIKDSDWAAKEIGRVLPQSSEILSYLGVDAYTNEGDHFNSRYICPNGMMETSRDLIFVTEIDPDDFMLDAIPGESSDIGMIVNAQFSM